METAVFGLEWNLLGGCCHLSSSRGLVPVAVTVGQLRHFSTHTIFHRYSLSLTNRLHAIISVRGYISLQHHPIFDNDGPLDRLRNLCRDHSPSWVWSRKNTLTFPARDMYQTLPNYKENHCSSLSIPFNSSGILASQLRFERQRPDVHSPDDCVST